LGRASGINCWAAVEDSVVVLGPPRSGKGLHLVIPAILDAPGAVVTTSTSPDNLAATMNTRKEKGPVAVFDPQGLVPDIASRMRWSPIRGCEVPRIAMARATALCAEPANGMENGAFWTQQCLTATRCLLHAAALDHRPPVELYRWSLSPLVAEEAADILRTRLLHRLGRQRSRRSSRQIPSRGSKHKGSSPESMGPTQRPDLTV
jgi:hypothetical protein